MTTIKDKPLLFPLKFPEDLKVWCDQQKAQGLPGTQYEFAKQIGVPPYYVTDWKTGRQGLPGEKYLSDICNVLGVDPGRYYPSSPDEKHKYSTSHISKVGKENESFAKEHGLNLEFVRALTELVDFNKLFPKYSKIVPAESNFLDGPTFVRQDNSDSAVIDHDLKYLQLNRDGKTYTLHKSDLAYLKEVQDQIIDFVEFLFFKRAKEMEDEVKKFNADSVVDCVGGGKLHVKITKEYIINHDRFAKYFDFSETDSKEGE